MLLIAAGISNGADPVPNWVVFSRYAAMGLGTLFGDGASSRPWATASPSSIRPAGSAPDSGGAITPFRHGVGNPVSTTHTIITAHRWRGSRGARRSARAGRRIVWARLLTIPAVPLDCCVRFGF